eukprot:scaffold4275_cov143-Skeletonema_marinoi.AAC.2
MLFTKSFTKSDDLMHIKSYAPDRADHWMSGRHPASDSSDHFTTRDASLVLFASVLLAWVDLLVWFWIGRGCDDENEMCR